MRRLLITTTALSVALGVVPAQVLTAQTMTAEGSIIADDGTVLCAPTADTSCDLAEVMQKLQDDAAAQAEAEAAAQAAIDAQAAADAEAAAQAEADAKAAADAEAAAQAEADAQAAADAEAAAQAEADAQAAADAEAAAQAEADAKAAADAEAAAQAEADAKAAADAEAAAQAEADAKAATDADAAAQAEADAKAATDAEAASQAEADAQAAAEAEAAAQAEADAQAAADAEAAAQAEADAKAATDAQTAADALVTAAPDTATEPLVDIPEPTEEAVDTLTTLLAAPDPTIEKGTIAAAATLVEPVAPTEGQPVEIAPSAEAQSVTTQTVTADTTRSSTQEFKAAPKKRKAGEKREKADGLTDLEKVGLLALGGLVVGAIINNSQDQVVANTGDRVVVQRGDGDYVVYKDDDALLRRPGSTVRTETFKDGSTRTIVQKADGSQIVTIRDATGRVLRRAAYDADGRETTLIDDLAPEQRIDVSTLPRPTGRVISMAGSEQDALLKARLAALDAESLGRTFSLRQIREIREVRQLAATVDVNNITFDSGSSAITVTEAEELAALGRFISTLVRENPGEVFLIEGHTDAVGSAATNLALSDRRAESVALALTEYFGVPPENLVVQGYGESELRVPTDADERQNRRVAVRIITPLLGRM
jgi:outer membrane protein OmpA-like peptidoglycan-associated protein